MRLRNLLRDELERRRRTKQRYSLRRFSRQLGVHHSTLSRILASQRGVGAATVRRIASRIGLDQARVDEIVRAEEVECLAEAIRRADFRPESRWLAIRTGLPVDRVNVVIHWLLHGGRLTMRTVNDWQVEDSK